MAGIINRNNCEEYFLDFHEGRLSEDLKKELLAFLELNPELEREFKNFERVTAPTSGKVYFDKDRLKKNTITAYNYKTWFIALRENDLSNEEKTEVEKFLVNNPGLNAELKLFSHTKIPVDRAVIFKDKSSLKKSAKVIPLYRWTYRVAAVAASVVLFLFVYKFNRHDNETHIAQLPTSTEVQTPLKQTEIKKLNQDVTIQAFQSEKKFSATTTHHKQNVKGNLALDRMPIETKLATSVQSSENPVAVNRPAAEDLDSVRSKYKVFSDDELADLKQSNASVNLKEAVQSSSSRGLSKLFGDNIKIENKTNDIDSSSTFALVVGKFEFSRTVSR